MEFSSRTRSLWWSGGRSALRELLLGGGKTSRQDRAACGAVCGSTTARKGAATTPSLYFFFPLRPSSKIWAATSLNIKAGRSIFIYLSLIYSKRRWERHGDREMDPFVGISNSFCLSGASPGCRGTTNTHKSPSFAPQKPSIRTKYS